MGPNDDHQQLRARRAYELGRLWASRRHSWLVVPVVALGLMLHTHLALALAAGVGLFLAATALSWRGEAWGRALWPGYIAGAFPLVLPGLARAGWSCCIAGRCFPMCMVLCSVGGLLAGGVLGWLATRQDRGRMQFLAGASVMAVLTGALGCGIAGLWGLAGMVVALLVSSAPIYVRLAARAG